MEDMLILLLARNQQHTRLVHSFIAKTVPLGNNFMEKKQVI